ncbi:MAG: prepilin-type N-terminal cleavage/methylation domain-containing protein [Verrucomicrobiota bacterium]
MKMHAQPQRGGFTLVELLVVIVIIVTLAGLATPQLIKMIKKGDQMTAISNGKQMMASMIEFNNEYGSFPDKETAKAVTERTGSPLSLTGDTANDYFRQLIAAKILKSEDPFFAKTSISRTKPDNKYTGTEALKAGEVGFGYIMNGMVALSNDDPNRIIAVAPLLNNSAKGDFDADPMDKAVMVYLDASVKLLDIRDDKKISMGKGKTLLDYGEGTIWGEDIKPVIKVPKKR